MPEPRYYVVPDYYGYIVCDRTREPEPRSSAPHYVVYGGPDKLWADEYARLVNSGMDQDEAFERVRPGNSKRVVGVSR